MTIHHDQRTPRKARHCCVCGSTFPMGRTIAQRIVDVCGSDCQIVLSERMNARLERAATIPDWPETVSNWVLVIAPGKPPAVFTSLAALVDHHAGFAEIKRLDVGQIVECCGATVQRVGVHRGSR